MKKAPFYPSQSKPLRPEAFLPLPLGAVLPGGWLKDQLHIQADGLTGHLEEFWPDLGPRNMWLGGDMEGWERAPYYLDGLVPLAYLLDDERLKAMAQRWIDAILSRQREDGWIGPVEAPNRRPYDIWPVMVVLKVLTQYHETTGDDRALKAVSGFCRWLQDHMDEHPLFEWGHYRWADLVLSVDWLFRRTGEAWLPQLAEKIHAQGYDWTAHFTDFIYTQKTPRDECTLKTHVVNNAMAIKTPGVWAMHSGSDADRDAVYRALENLDRYHGQATGVFSGDEHYAGPDPTQGTELCAVVEYMFSLEVLLSLYGDPAFGDRLERIAYNALPGTFTADMWAHQYDQQANQVLCSIAPRHWTNNDDTSNIYGLEPNYGCCTSNLHQGWPKLTSHLWMATPTGGLAAVAYAPCSVTARVGEAGNEVKILEETGYPFRESITLTIQAEGPVRFPLSLRIPGWAEGATLRYGGEEALPEPGTFHEIDREWKPGDKIEINFPMALRAEPRYRNAVSIVRGPLVFALRVGEVRMLVRGEPPHGDWEFHPTTPWNIGLILDPAHPEVALEVQEAPITAVPFDTAHPPLVLKGRGRRISGWHLARNSAGPTPESPVSTHEPVEKIEMAPYGSTQLRVTELPYMTE